MAAGGLALATGSGAARAARVDTGARIVILGAGAAGVAPASRLTERLRGATVTLLDPWAEHWYQPGFALIAAGLKPASRTIWSTAEWIPRGATPLPEVATEIDPESRIVTTAAGTKLGHDFLIVATGLVLDWAAIEGFSLDLVGPDHGIGAHDAGPDFAAGTRAAMDAFTSKGGQALIGRPATEMTCASAPLKFAFLTKDTASRKGTRGKVAVTHRAPGTALFAVAIVSEKVRMLCDERGIGVLYDPVQNAIDPAARTATYARPPTPRPRATRCSNGTSSTSSRRCARRRRCATRRCPGPTH